MDGQNQAKQTTIDKTEVESDLLLNDPHYFPQLPPVKVIEETTEQKLTFNVMSERPVSESLFIERYFVWNDAIVGEFNRKYESTMEKSPDHLIFLSALVYLQKLIYVIMCHKLDIPYDEAGKEKLKIWPTKVKCGIPKLVRKTKGLRQSFIVDKLEVRSDGSYLLTGRSYVGAIYIEGEAIVFKI